MKGKKSIPALALVLALCAGLLVIPAGTAMSIQVGEYVQMGTYYGEPILWRCVDIDENGPLMLSDKILCLKAFDAEASQNTTTGSHSRSSGRASYESNYWGDSNLRSWLNSAASAGNVTWLCGDPPIAAELWNSYNAYDQEAGFLSNFTQSERNAMKEVSQKSFLAYPEIDAGMATTGSEQFSYNSSIDSVVQNYDTAYAEYVTDKMFLLDVKQINAVYNNGAILGADYYIGEPTAACVTNSEYKSSSLAAGNKWYSWLRSPGAGSDSNVRYVNSDGRVYYGYGGAHYGGVGVRPAFYLDASSSIQSGRGSAADPYIVGSFSGIGVPSTQTVLVDGEAVTFYAYALKDANGNDTNYVKLRDVAAILNGTAAQFEVGWDGAIRLTTGAAYTVNGTENMANFSGDQPYTVSASPVTVNGETVNLDAITLTDSAGGGYTYFKLRDLGDALGFAVDWNPANGIFIETR